MEKDRMKKNMTVASGLLKQNKTKKLKKENFIQKEVRNRRGSLEQFIKFEALTYTKPNKKKTACVTFCRFQSPALAVTFCS